ncbi:DNA (cytosine-5)-methyltransferase 1 [Bradyrhizobium japonicum]|uniref:DNA (cytosine-5-)-methyltransferase n=2 Tax=Bradyrhizobium japonicum TaxID=375 RepID=A0A0A3XKA5_BRAJP|nr:MULTISPECIES: DNA cytosine methyltransferase [Bradyrhizobium]KGT73689.1 DNA methyltransferase [Bradyrhizobium japonicum]
MRKRKILVADLLCGAGGSSTGCERALRELGLEMELVCVNHWQTAIDTHKLNHPAARHVVQDIASVRPHILVPEGYLDLLMASPSCTHHSVARGGKPTSDQQRSDPWHIITWLTELRVKRLIVENVWEFTSWGPVDARTGKPIKSRKGEYFRAWINTIRALGFEPEWRKLNAADYGDATTRQRFILMARNDGRSVSWPMPTHIKASPDKLLFLGMKPWRPARDIIDWDLKGRSIFGRKKPLAPKTLARIYAGAVKFGWPDPFLVILRNHMDGKSVDGPLPTIAANGTHIGIAQPTINGEIVPSFEEWFADTKTLGGSREEYDRLYPVPFVMAPGSSGAPRATHDPLPTITTGGAGVEERPGCARPMLVEPFILNRHGDNGGNRAHGIDAPAPTANCDGGGYLVEPFILSRHAEGAPRSVDEPTPTQVAKQSHILISPYYGSGSGETCQSAEEPLPTVTSKGRFGMVVPVTHTHGGNAARDVADPLPTLTTAKGGEFAMVMPVTHADRSDRVRDPAEDPLPTVTGANRGELAFIAAQFGEREGQAPRVHDVEQPTPAICATGHINLVEATPQFDILFRMLEPHELAAAMGFNSEEADYEFAGTKTEKIKQIGNAVSVAKMRACVSAIMGDAAAIEQTKPSQRRAVA